MKKQATSAELRAALDQKEANRCSKLVHFIASSSGYLPVDPPKMAGEIRCPFCDCPDFFLWGVDKERTAWMCERICVGSTLPKQSGSVDTPPTSLRAVLWPVWCQINGIGDTNHDVRFENVHQPENRIAFMLKFAATPRSVLLMQGSQGSGKTYAAMAICELFTRKSTACIFATQRQMLNKWLETFKQDSCNDYVKRITEIDLLVIDDFGIGEATAAFMSFIMDLINTRLQWTNRGTIITTNLEDSKMLALTNPAFMDRMKTGYKMAFKEEKSRRKQTVI